MKTLDDEITDLERERRRCEQEYIDSYAPRGGCMGFFIAFLAIIFFIACFIGGMLLIKLICQS